MVVRRKTRSTQSKRKGVPLLVRLRDDQATRLDELCKSRKVTKTALVQFAMDRIFVEIDHGQLELPLGLDAQK
jgi:hypothetical protein